MSSSDNALALPNNPEQEGFAVETPKPSEERAGSDSKAVPLPLEVGEDDRVLNGSAKGQAAKKKAVEDEAAKQEEVARLEAAARRRAARRRKKKRLAKKKKRPPLMKTNISDEVVVKFEHVTKRYMLYEKDRGRIVRLISKTRSGLVGETLANNDLSFEIKKGEAVAFLGSNGAGKSTALKMVTGVAHPTSGTVTVTGHVSALLELTAGFDAQLTGRENIRLRGLIMGMSEEEIDRVAPSVIEFADLGLYIDQPLRSYSSGMKSRLGFGFAVATEPDILIVDEALSVGDKTFRRKCLKRVREIMMDEQVTVLFVTHSSSVAQEFCSRGIVLDHGKMVFDGPIKDAVSYYEKMTGELTEGH